MISIGDIARRVDDIGALARLWDGARGDSSIPTRTQIDAAFDVAGFSNYLEVGTCLDDLFYRRIGKDAHRLFPTDLTGTSMTARMQPQDRDFANVFFRACFAHPCGAWADYSASWGAAHQRVKITGLGLPFFDADTGASNFISTLLLRFPPESAGADGGIHSVTRLNFSTIDFGAGVPAEF